MLNLEYFTANSLYAASQAKLQPLGPYLEALDAKGDRWIYVPLWGPPSKQVGEFKFTNGEAPDGSVMAFKVALEDERGRVTVTVIRCGII